jgi:anti-sigma factor RsiW
MSERDIAVTEDELHAFVDGELAPDRRAAVEDWLATHADDDARVAAWRAIGDAVRARYSAVADEPVPQRLDLNRLKRVPSRWMMGAIAATLVAFIAGGSVGWLAHGATAAPVVRDVAETLSDEAIAAHRLYIGEVRHPIEVRADESHLIPWLSRRLGTPLKAPDFSDFGLRLMGGRLLPGIEGPAALFMYENGNGERFTLYSTPLKTSSPTSFRYREGDKYASVRWVSDNYGWVVSGPQDKERLKKVATVAYQQMENRAR